MSERYAEALQELKELLRDIEITSDETVYGYFVGGDPRDFSPDPECSTEEERERHKAACAEFERSGNNPNPAPHCAFFNGDTEAPGFGMGINSLRNETMADWADRLSRCLARLESE